jgi:hypothetical protein
LKNNEIVVSLLRIKKVYLKNLKPTLMKTSILSKVLIGIILTFLMYNCRTNLPNSVSFNDTICTNYPIESASELPVALVHDMVNGYKKNQLHEIEQGISKNGRNLTDAHSIWFDLETLKKFVYHIENTTIKTDTTKSSKDLGVRIYYASYPSKDSLGWQKPEYNGVLTNFGNTPLTTQYDKLHTLVMIPTRREGKLNIDFNPFDIDTYKQSLKSPELVKYSRNQQTPSNNNYPTIMSLGGPITNNTTAQNHGSLIPPANKQAEGF